MLIYALRRCTPCVVGKFAQPTIQLLQVPLRRFLELMFVIAEQRGKYRKHRLLDNCATQTLGLAPAIGNQLKRCIGARFVTTEQMPGI